MSESIYNLQLIETERLVIRPVKPGDEYVLNALIKHSLELLQKWEPWAKDPRLEVTQEFVQKNSFGWESKSGNNFPMVIILKEGNQTIGVTGFNDKSNLQQGIYEIGYWLDIDFHGKGFATECTNALTRYAFNELSCNSTVLNINTINTASAAVAGRLLYQNQGTRPRAEEDSAIGTSHEDYIYTHTKKSFKRLMQNKLFYSVSVKKKSKNCVVKSINWAIRHLDVAEQKFAEQHRLIVNTPWSFVAKLKVTDGWVYLKQAPQSIAEDPQIIMYLKNECNISVPHILAESTDNNCFIMSDGGISCRTLLKNKYDEKLIYRILENFSTIQNKLSTKAETLIEAGVPDWRLDKMTNLYSYALNDEKVFANISYFKDKHGQLTSELGKLQDICDKLATYNIIETVVQPDFNDNNTVLEQDSNVLTAIDLGEIVISHPFLSLINFMFQMKKHYLIVDEFRVNSMIDKYLHAFDSENNDLDKLKEAYTIARELWPFYGFLAYHRLMSAAGSEEVINYCPGKIELVIDSVIRRIYE